MSTIATTLNHGVYLGTSGSNHYSYLSPLTITSTGAVTGPTPGSEGNAIAVWGAYQNTRVTLFNDGTIGGAGVTWGVWLDGGGLIVNDGTILPYNAVYGSADTTLVNAGTIGKVEITGTVINSGGIADVYFFGDGGTLELNPGATVGTVSVQPHGYGAVGVTATANLVLESGAGAGTVSGLDTTFGAITSITVASGATWTFAGHETLESGQSLTIDGTADVTGSFTSNGDMTASGALSLGGVFINNGRLASALPVSVTGTFTNGEAGTVTGNGTVIDSDGPVTNRGYIASGNSSSGIGVWLAGGGTLSNIGANQTYVNTTTSFNGDDVHYTSRQYGTIAAGQIGVYVAGGSGTITNTGTVNATGATGAGVDLTGGGLVDNGAFHIGGIRNFYRYDLYSGRITGANGILVTGGSGTVNNQGVITGDGSYGAAISLAAGGTVANNNYSAFDSYFNRGYTIPGIITSTGTDGIGIAVSGAAGSITNNATISATGPSGIAISLAAGGSVENGASNTAALVSGAAAGVIVSGQPATIDNSAVITGPLDYGVALKAGGLVQNSGTITGFDGVVVASPDAGTVINSGTIMGAASGIATGVVLGYGGTLIDSGFIGGGRAIYNGGGSLLLELLPGYRLSGAIDVKGYGNRLELGGTAGTISGLGTRFTNFPTIVVDAGAAWTLTGGNNLGTYTLDGAGTLTNDGSLLTGLGVFVDQPVTLRNASSIGGDVRLTQGAVFQNLAGASVEASGTAIVAQGGATIMDAGAISGGQEAIYLGGTGGNLLQLAPGFQLNGVSTHGTDNRVELLSGASAGSLAGSIASVINGISVDAGADWTVAGTVSAGISLGAHSTLQIAAAATVSTSGNGVYTSVGPATLLNNGAIDAGALGVSFAAGGAVTNAMGAGIAGGAGGIFIGGGGVVANSGQIGAVTSGAGVTLSAGGTVSNATSGTISGVTGIQVGGAAGTVDNSGTVLGTQGTSGSGVGLLAGGVITNGSAALIQGTTRGAYAIGRVAAVTNLGTIQALGATGVGVFLGDGGGVTNSGSAALISGALMGVSGGSAAPVTVVNTGTISGAVGVDLLGGGTVIDTGTVLGSTAIYLGGTGNNRLELGAGYALTGAVEAQGTANSLEVLSGTVNGANLPLADFSNITVDAGATLTLTAAESTIAAGATLSVSGTLKAPGSITLDGGNLLQLGAGYQMPAINLASGTRLELLAGNGTLSRFGGDFSGLAAVTADSGADWTLAGSYTIMSGFTIGGTFTVATSLQNDGTVAGQLLLANNASVTNAASGVITNPSIGLTSTAASVGIGATLDNQGTISATGVGVTLQGGLLINSGSAALIEGSALYFAVKAGTSAAATVLNTGTLSGGVSLGNVSDVLNNSGTSALIEGPRFGVDGKGTVINAGTIIATDTTGLTAGIYMAPGGTIIDTGTIIGKIAIQLLGYDELALGAGYSLQTLSAGPGLSYPAVNVRGTANVLNLMSGTASGTNLPLTSFATIEVQAGATLSDVTLGNAATLQVYGTVAGATVLDTNDLMRLGVGYGVAGPVAGNASSALELMSGSATGTISGIGNSFTNFGTVMVDSGASWALSGGNSVANGVTLATAADLIVGAGMALTSSGTAVIATAGGATLTDSGVISGATAAILGGGGNLLRLAAGYALGGSIIASGASNEVELLAGAAGTLAGFGTSLLGFGTIFVDSGATWTLNAADTLGSGVTLSNTGGTVIADGLTNSASIVTGLGVFQAGTGGFSNQAYVAGDVSLAAGATITNATGAVIRNGGTAISGIGTAVSVLNQGTIASTALTGIYLGHGGSLSNSASGIITGNYYGVSVQLGTADVTNTGVISAGNASGDGIALNAGGTLIDSGTISGRNFAVYLGGTGSNLLQLETGYSLSGRIILSSFASNTIALSDALGTITASYDTLGLGQAQAIAFDNTTGAPVTLQLAATSGTVAPLIQQFTSIGDVIDLTQLSDTAGDARYTLSGHTLTVIGDSGSVTFDLATVPAHLAVQSDGSGGTDVVVCFAAGTQIGTPDGEVPVERLQIGDLVLTAHNGARPVTWIGQGKVLATRGRRSAATPVIVRKGALADNVPNRDLRVTKAHSLYIDDVLIPVEFLVNHRTILWDDRAQEVAIYHVELDSHDVLLANGAPAESYRDDGNRWLFHNANAGWHLPPQDPYASVLTGGAVVDAVWRRLLDRAGPRALPPLTGDPDLHLLVDGARVNAEEQQGSVYVFRLPPSPKSVVIASREAVPAEFGIARDPRSLGVALRRVTVRQGAKFMLFEADDGRLTAGFHAFEPDCNLRWTDGYAELPAAAFAQFDKGAEVMLHLGGATQYPDDRASPARTAA